MKQRLINSWTALKFGLRHLRLSWTAYTATPEVQALRRAFRVFWWRLGDALLLLLRWMWGWFVKTRPARAVADWWARTKRAVHFLPQYRFLCRFYARLRANVWLRWAFAAALVLMITLPYCVTPPKHEEHTYVLITDDFTRVVEQYPTFDYESDRLRVGTHTGGDAQVILPKGEELLIRCGDQVLLSSSYGETVENLLDRLNVTVGRQQMVGVNVTGLKTLIQIDEEIRCRRKERTEQPHEVKELYNYLMEYGEHVVLQPGSDGVIVDTYDDVYRDGELITSVLVDRSDSSAVTEIRETGRLVGDVDREDRIAYDRPYGGGSSGGYLVFESGYSMTYSDKVLCNSTAYYSGGEGGAAWTTATGHAVGVGIIAADPTVFPYHTRMFIQTTNGSRVYGVSQVEDCGGAVKGNVVDLWFPSYGDCVSWGRRDVYCWILD